MLNMNNFAIKIEPGLPETPFHGSISLDEIDAKGILSRHPEKYDIIYNVGGQAYRYYPASILTILNDLHQEWELIRSRKSHAMTLSGYTVLNMDIDGEAVMLRDPLSTIGQPVSDVIWVVAIEEAFREATEKVLGAIHGAG
jgi:hypothetical protein